MTQLSIEAPVDVFVSEVAKDGPILAGQKILTLESPTLDRLQSTLDSLQTHIAIIERPLLDGRLDSEITALTTKAQALQAVVTLTTDTIAKATLEGKLGIGWTYRDFNDMQIAQVQAKNAVVDANLAASHAAQKKIDLQDKIAAAKSKLIREQAYLMRMRKALIVEATSAGIFKAQAAVGSFLRKGKVIGEIEI